MLFLVSILIAGAFLVYGQSGSQALETVAARILKGDGKQVVDLAERDPRIIVVAAAMLDGTGLVEFQERFPERCIDVGMAEHYGGRPEVLEIRGDVVRGLR